jgi:putative ABC transport system permease protein
MPLGLPLSGGAQISVSPFNSLETGRAAQAIAVSDGFFGTFGIRTVRGRSFDNRDRSSTAKVALLSEYSARALFGADDPLGRLVFVRQPSISPTVIEAIVVGVASDTDVYRVGNRDGLVAYLPLDQGFASSVVFAALVDGDPTAGADVLRSAIHRIDSDLALTASGIARRVLEGPFVIIRMIAIIVGALGCAALLLAMTGLFGVLSHVVARRAREFGLRMALGADRRQVIGMIVRQGAGPVLDGLALGLIAGTLGRLILRVTIAEPITLFDPWSVLLVLPFAAAAAAACYLPAHRAASLDPAVALREL